VKLDTEAFAQLFVPHTTRSVRRQWRRAAGISNLLVPTIGYGKSRKYRFHHEIATDSVVVSLLYSKKVIQTVGTDNSETNAQKGQVADEVHEVTSFCIPPCIADCPGKIM
jgi:hypothetical protein